MGREVQSLKFKVQSSETSFGVASRYVVPETLNFKPETAIDISHLPTGIYLLRIQTENGMVTRRIIKN